MHLGCQSWFRNRPNRARSKYARSMREADVVIVSYNSRDRLRACVRPLLELPDVNVIVVDNASPDGSLEAVGDLPLTAIQLSCNRGFAHGVNAGWRAGSAPYVLLLNPDAHVDGRSLAALAAAVEERPDIGAAAPRIVRTDGSLDFSLRRFPRLRSTYAQALFVHRLFPAARWTDEVVRERPPMATPVCPTGCPAHASSLRRTARGDLDGFDEGFFMYCEDKDLCRGSGRSATARLRAGALVGARRRRRRRRARSSCPCSRRAGFGTRPSTTAALYALSRDARGRPRRLTHAAVGRGGKSARAGHCGRSSAGAHAALSLAIRLGPLLSPAIDRRCHAVRDYVWRVMCGICGVVQVRGEPRPVVAPEVLDRMTDAMTHRGPNDRGTYRARRDRARRPPPQHRRRRRRPSAGVRTRTARSGRSRTASSTTTPSSARRLAKSRPHVPDALRHRDPPAPLRGCGRASSRSTFAACSASPSGTADERRAVRRARPARRQAALLRRSRATCSSSPRS